MALEPELLEEFLSVLRGDREPARDSQHAGGRTRDGVSSRPCAAEGRDGIMLPTLAAILVLLRVLTVPCSLAVPVVVTDGSAAPPTPAPPVTLRLRNGTEYSTVTWDPSTVALLVIDPWSFHWCKTACMRVGALMPRINAATAAGRKLGMTVIWSPTDAQENYDGWPARERALWVPPVEPVLKRNSSIPSGGAMTPFGTQCMCGPWLPSLINADEMRMDPSLFIGPEDYIAGGSTVNEIYSIFVKHKIEHIIYLGVHENICVQGKAEGMDNMWKLGEPGLSRRVLRSSLG